MTWQLVNLSVSQLGPLIFVTYSYVNGRLCIAKWTLSLSVSVSVSVSLSFRILRADTRELQRGRQRKQGRGKREREISFSLLLPLSLSRCKSRLRHSNPTVCLRRYLHLNLYIFYLIFLLNDWFPSSLMCPTSFSAHLQEVGHFKKHPFPHFRLRWWR